MRYWNLVRRLLVAMWVLYKMFERVCLGAAWADLVIKLAEGDVLGAFGQALSLFVPLLIEQCYAKRSKTKGCKEKRRKEKRGKRRREKRREGPAGGKQNLHKSVCFGDKCIKLTGKVIQKCMSEAQKSGRTAILLRKTNTCQIGKSNRRSRPRGEPIRLVLFIRKALPKKQKNATKMLH